MQKCFMIRPSMFLYQLYWHFPATSWGTLAVCHVHRWQDSSKLSVNLQQFEYASYHELYYVKLVDFSSDTHQTKTQCLKDKCWCSELNFWSIGNKWDLLLCITIYCNNHQINENMFYALTIREQYFKYCNIKGELKQYKCVWDGRMSMIYCVVDISSCPMTPWKINS